MYFNSYALVSLTAAAGVLAGNSLGQDDSRPTIQHRYHAQVPARRDDVLEKKEFSTREVGDAKASGGYHGGPDACEDYGHAVVVNKCPYDVWLWSIAHDTDGPYRLGCGEAYIEKYYDRCGVAIEVVKHRHDWDSDTNKLVFYYKIHYGQVLYDLYGNCGNSFGGHKLVLRPEDHSCPKVEMDDGYGGPSHKKYCQEQSDLVLTLCEGEYHRPPGRPHPHPPPPHPPPPPKEPEYPPPHGPPAEPPYRPPHRPPHRPPYEPPNGPPSGPPYGPPHEPPYEPPYEPPHESPHEPPYEPPYEPPHGPPYGPPSAQHENGPSSARPSTSSPTPAARNPKARSDDGQAGGHSTRSVVERDISVDRWENDKPDWDTDAKCTDCGPREKGVVAMFDLDADMEEVD